MEKRPFAESLLRHSLVRRRNSTTFLQTFYWDCCKTVCFGNTLVFYFQAQFLQINTLLSEKIPVFFPICTFPQTTSLSNTKKSSDARTNLFLSVLRNIPRSHGGIAYPPNPRRSFGRNIQREMPGVPYIRAGAYAPLHGFAFYANPPSYAGRLRSSTVGFAEPFRSVCRNLSGKLPSHPFAALTGLRGCAAGAVG